MSRQLDISKFKDVFLNSFQVGEIWHRGVLLYVKKRPPKVTIKVSASNDKIHLTAQFVDYEHRYRYADERKYSSSVTKTHGIVYSNARFFLNTSITASGMKKINFGSYRDDGTFSYSLSSSQYGFKGKNHWFKAWIAYIDPETGKNAVAYSGIIGGVSYNYLVGNDPIEA